MIMNISCRLKAYAKLTAVVQGGGGTGGDDFLKTTLTTPVDTVIDLGYKDVVSNKEVYSVRRHFTHRFANYEDGYLIQLGENIEKHFTFFCAVKNEDIGTETISSKYCFIEDNKIYLRFYTPDEEVESEDYEFDIYFVFTCTEDGADIGDVEFEADRFDLEREEINCTVTVETTKGNEVDDGVGVLEKGVSYIISASPNDGYNMDTLTLNGEDIESGETHECIGDFSIYAEAKKSVEPTTYTIETNKDIGVESLQIINTSTSEPIDLDEDGDGTINEGITYRVHVTTKSGYHIDSITLEDEEGIETQIENDGTFVCSGYVYVNVVTATDKADYDFTASVVGGTPLMSNIYLSISGGSLVGPGEGVLVDGEQYTLFVYIMGAKVEAITLNGEPVSSGYSFVCSGNVNIVVTVSNPPIPQPMMGV